MLREQCWTLLNVIPEADLTKTSLMLKNGISINIDTIFRKEKDYLLVRGREAGSNDEGRAFFLPYEEISYIKIEKMVRLNELRAIYGEALQAGGLADADDDELAQIPQPATTLKPTVPLAPAAALDPAAVAKANLLERIRHARTSAARK